MSVSTSGGTLLLLGLEDSHRIPLANSVAVFFYIYTHGMAGMGKKSRLFGSEFVHWFVYYARAELCCQGATPQVPLPNILGM